MVEHNIPANLQGRNIILGSQSPRRLELLTGVKLPFIVKIIDNIDESFPPNLPVNEIPIYIAQKKADAYLTSMLDNDILITADTIVEINNRMLGKPINRDEAISMLHTLAGQTHHVITGVCITAKHKAVTFSTLSSVDVAPLSSSEIEYYVDAFQPYDKAGAYGIQEWFGYVAVERIEGSFYNVMGLPVQRLYRELLRF